MDRKARLNRADAYQVAVGGEHAARMVAAYAAGRPGPRRLGSEQGVVPGWDDLVIEREDGVLEHHQVKSQTTDFSAKSIDEDSTRSSLEKDLAALASWTPPSKGPSRQFVLDLRTEGVQIRKELSVAHFETLAEECARESADADLFAEREKTSPLNERLGRWLRTRCDFKDWTHIIGRLKLMRVRHCEAPTNIEDRAKVVLEPLFSPAATAYAELRHFLLDESGPTQATTPAILYEHLRPRVRSGASEWAAWIRSDSDWAALGTVARDAPAHAVVDRVWAPAGRGARVAIHSPAPESGDQTLMPRAVARLALHSTGPITVHLDDANRWRDQATTWVGGTLGMSDGARPGAHWCAAEPRPAALDARRLDAGDDEAETLEFAMDDSAWELVKQSVDESIRAVVERTERATIQARWKAWKEALDKDPQTRRAWIRDLTVARAEAGRIEPALRVGPATTRLAAKAIILVLYIVEVSGASDARWDRLGSGRSLRTIALQTWSGPPGRAQPRDVDRTVQELLDGETADAVFLTGVRCSVTEALNLSMADTPRSWASIASPRHPKVLLTNPRAFRDAVDAGLAALKELVGEALKAANWRDDALTEAIAEVSAAK